MPSSATFGLRTLGGWEAIADSGLSARQRFGRGDEPSRDLTFGTGTGVSQINTIYKREFTIAAAGHIIIDLTGGAGEKDVLNLPLVLAKVRAIDVVLTTTPAAGVVVRVGPLSESNGWVGPFQDVDSWVGVARRWFADNPFDGWAVNSGSRILRINNPSAGSISGVIEIFGTSS